MPRDAEARAEQVAAVFRQIPLATLISALNAAIMVAVLAANVPDPRLFAWLAAVLVVAAVRLVVWRAYRSDPSPSTRISRWETTGVGLTVVVGLVWGGGAAWLWPPTEVFQLFWVFVIGGMCAGAAALNYAHLPTAFAFILPAGVPVAARYAVEGTGTGHGLAAAAMIAVFLTALVVTVGRTNRQYGDYLRLRSGLAQKARELEAANVSLQREVEDHHATEAKLHHAQKMEALGQLTGGIAHDFNNLLTVVIGNLALMRKRLPAGDERTTRLLNNAIQGADRGAVLTQRLLAFGRRQTLRPEIVDLPALVSGMSELLRRSIGAGHWLEADLPDGLPAVRVDANQLELALLNLVLNSRDAMHEGGRIRIAATERHLTHAGDAELAAGRYVVLGVTDCGEGMDAATLAKATEPFFTTKAVGVGTGLGLSMVHGLAAQSGGRLVLRSTAGAGTVADLWLPVAEDAAEPMPDRPAAVMPPAPVPRQVVLLVDDDPLVLASAAGMLEELGHGVVEAGSARQALDRLAKGPPVDLVVADYGMPGMTGLELAEALRRLRPRMPVLIATGYGEVPAIEAAGFARLSKPFGQDALGAALTALLEGRETEAA